MKVKGKKAQEGEAFGTLIFFVLIFVILFFNVNENFECNSICKSIEECEGVIYSSDSWESLICRFDMGNQTYNDFVYSQNNIFTDIDELNNGDISK
jgi:hypothetical protein